MFFRKRERNPLAQAVSRMEEATAILHRHWSDKHYQPSEADLVELKAMEQVLFRLAATAGRLVTRLERRFDGEPVVNEAKWLDWRER